MNRSGLVVVPLLMAVIGFAAWVSMTYDLDRLAYGMTPLVVVSRGPWSGSFSMPWSAI